jgi:hypothetical protein
LSRLGAFKTTVPKQVRRVSPNNQKSSERASFVFFNTNCRCYLLKNPNEDKALAAEFCGSRVTDSNLRFLTASDDAPATPFETCRQKHGRWRECYPSPCSAEAIALHAIFCVARPRRLPLQLTAVSRRRLLPPRRMLHLRSRCSGPALPPILLLRQLDR